LPAKIVDEGKTFLTLPQPGPLRLSADPDILVLFQAAERGIRLRGDISPLGIMIEVNLQNSFLTPPFGFALFYLRGVPPGSVTTHAIYRGVVPFILMQLALLVALWFWPQMATWLPEALK